MKIKNLFALLGFFILATSANYPIKTKTAEDPVITAVSNDSFAEFLSHFEKKELPFDIRLGDLKGYDDFKKNNTVTEKAPKKTVGQSPISNSEFIPGAQFARMSRMGPPELTPVARFYPSENIIAVIYSSSLRFGSGLDKSYNMVVYDMRGNILPATAKEKIGQSFLVAQSSVEQSITCHIDEKGRVWKNTYKNKWKESLDDKWINENEITGFEIEDTEVFALNRNGELEKLKEIPTEAKAYLD